MAPWTTGHIDTALNSFLPMAEQRVSTAENIGLVTKRIKIHVVPQPEINIKEINLNLKKK